MDFVLGLQPVTQWQSDISDDQPAAGRLEPPMRRTGGVGGLIDNDSRRRRSQKLLPTVK
jgi:hypothetical protein